MGRSFNQAERVRSFLASKDLALWLILFFCLSLIPGTFAEANFRLSILSSVILACFTLNLALCTLRRIRSLAKPVLIMHIGTLLILAGGVVGSFGFVATTNVYEGTRVSTAYRWDIEKDIPLGVDLFVKKINIEYYPVPVRVGVLKSGEKVGLFELKTGESFNVGQYRVTATSLQYPSDSLNLTVFQGDQLVGRVNTEGDKDLPEDFPYDFKLVANKNPHMKKIGIDMEISRGSDVMAAGTVEINRPLTFETLSFYNTETGVDKHGLQYAGIQITKDPGRPYVFFGFLVMGIGSIMWGYRKIRS